MGKFVLASVVLVPLLALVAYSDPSYRLFPQDDVPGLINLLHHPETHGDDKVAENIARYIQQQNGDLGSEGRRQEMVDYFYNLVTDFYEYGWGTSFHFAHTLATETHEASILRHEMRVLQEIRLSEGDHALDAGCGVGGPARNIARASRARVTGVTLNEYQVLRAALHTKREDMGHLVDVQQGDYTRLKYPDNHFDAVRQPL